MALLQISEPGGSRDPHQKNIAIGIDLGTTNSLVATIQNGVATVLKNRDNDELIPSVVYYAPNQVVTVGRQALTNRVADPANTIISVKRFMGQGVKDIMVSDYPYQIKNKNRVLTFTTSAGDKNPVQVSADILGYLKQIALANLGDEPIGAVITVPAYFDDNQRQATKQAAALAGLTVLRLLNEPTAAAIAYGLESKQQGIFLVYDLGGGTLDVSILKLHNEIFEVLAVNGDTHLGGDDFDRLIYQFICGKANLSNLNVNDIALLMNVAKDAKEQLSSTTLAHLRAELTSGQKIQLQLSREEFAEISQDLIKRSLIPVKKALYDAGIAPTEVNEVIMVGGSTRLIVIQNTISQFFNKVLLNNIDPDKVVALGAAIQADILAGNRKNDWLLLDVTPLSLGIETMGGIVERIVPRNSTLPLVRAQEFTTYKDGQTAMSIHVVQGERELATDCRSLAKFSLKGIPPMAAGGARVRVTFQIDTDGLLTVSAQEQTTKVNTQIEIKPSFGLAAEQISAMLQSSIIHANDDIAARQLVEATTEAQALIDAVSEAFIQDKDLLTVSEQTIINQTLMKLQQTLAANLSVEAKAQAINKLSKELNQATENFAAKRMNKAVQQEFTGKDINSL